MESVLTKGARHCSFCRAFSNKHFEKIILMNFISTDVNLLQHVIFTIFLVVKDYEECALRKELIIAPFVDWFKTVTLRKSE